MPIPGQGASSAIGVIEFLLYVMVASLFIPEEIAIQLGVIKLTPAFAVSILLFPLLTFGARLKWVWPDLFVVALFTSIFISSALNSSLERSVESLGRLVLASVVPFLAGRFIMQEPARAKRLLSLLLLLMAMTGLFALLESLVRFNIHSHIWGVRYSPHHEKRLGFTRAHGWTTHAIMFGLVNATFISVILVAAKEKIKLFGRWPWIKLIAISTGCFLSLSTGAWGPAAVSVALVAWDYYAPFNPKKLWPVTAAVMIIGYYVLEFASGRPLLRILMMELHLTSPDAWYYRWRLYERVFEVMPGHWWLGHGLNTPSEFRGFQSSIDNNFLLMLMQYGRVGLILWIAVPVAIILFAGKAVWAQRPTKTIRLTRAMCFSVFGMLLTQLSVALFSTPRSMYWMMMGLVIGGVFMCRAEQTMLSKRSKKRQPKQKRPNQRPPQVRAPRDA